MSSFGEIFAIFWLFIRFGSAGVNALTLMLGGLFHVRTIWALTHVWKQIKDN